MRFIDVCALAALALPALAQRHDFGIHGGGSLYQKKTISNPRGTADAGFSTGWLAGFTVGNDMYEHFGGEIRYNYLNNKMKLESGSTQATFSGRSHAIHYDVLIYGSGREAPIRPYVAVGGGAKIYQGTGTEQAFQPLSNIGILTKTTDVRGLVSFGGGVKARLSDRMMLRVDVHDYLTPFPEKVITPASGSDVSGWLNNIVASVGISWRF